VLTLRSEHGQLQALTGKQPGEQTLTAYDKRLTEMQEPLVEAQGHVETLYKEVIRGDAAPTAAQIQAADTVRAKLTPLLATWNQLQKELPALNKTLRSAKLTPIRPEMPPPRDLNVADEE
jgi:hypothetical protein